MVRMHYLPALKTVVGTSTVPYGYTLTVWSAGAVLMHERGSPDVGEIFLFIAGAIIAFAALALVARTASQGLDASENERIAAGITNAAAVGAAIGAVALIALIPTGADWPLGSFIATCVYLMACGLDLAVARAAGATQ
jgi:hypothetical protein